MTTEKTTVQLSDLYDADQRTTRPEVRRLAATVMVPHPLNNVRYADGISSCRHAKKHMLGQVCRQEVIPDEIASDVVHPREAAQPQTKNEPWNAPTRQSDWVLAHD